MGRKGSRLTEQRLIPFEAARDVAYPYDGPRALHRSPLRPNSCLVYSRIAVLFYADSVSQVVGSSAILSLSGYGRVARHTTVIPCKRESILVFSEQFGVPLHAHNDGHMHTIAEQKGAAGGVR